MKVAGHFVNGKVEERERERDRQTERGREKMLVERHKVEFV